jgi:alkanesulfonate monooxygenase SsuD/methylene tetrahydromethanopterin reductase-like flavin-dependent oxidoreductase (luciferase family)
MRAILAAAPEAAHGGTGLASPWSSAVKIGMTLPTMVPGFDRARLLAWCRRIDAGPFSSLAVGERVSFPNHDALVALAAAAAATERVRIVSTVFVAPLRSAVWLAKRGATLDVVSGGRFVMGLGVGGREEDYRVVGAAFTRRHANLDQQVAIMRRIWSGEPLLPGTAPVGPQPIQAGGPPLWIAASSRRPLERAARWADGLAGFQLGPDPAEIERLFRGAEAAWRSAGRSAPPWLATSFWFALGPDARAQLDAYVERYLAVFGPAAVEALRPRCHAAGDAALRQAIADVRDAGADELLLVPTSDAPDQLERVVDLLG